MAKTENKMQPLWDLQQAHIDKLEAIALEQKENPTFGVRKVRELIQYEKQLKRKLLGYRKENQNRKPPVQDKKQELPTAKHADRTKEKYSGRLTTQHTSDIKALEVEGLDLASISEKLWIEEKKIKSYLSKQKKEKGAGQILYVTNDPKKD
jgi:hypothetical protein